MNESLVSGGLRDLRRVLVGPDFPPGPPRSARAQRWWARWRSLAVPLVLLAVLGLGLAAAKYFDDTRGTTRLVAGIIGYATALPVLFAFHRPLLAWRLSFVMLFVGTLDVTPTESWPWNPVQICFFLIVLAALALRADAGIVAWAGLLTLIPVFLYVDPASAWGVSVLFLAVLILGDQVRRRRQSQRRLAEQEEVSDLEKARRAVLEERARIAREMHDVVAHHMSMIAVQAETAPFRLPDLTEPVRLEFTSIAGSARAAMTDMRRLLGVLRSEPGPALTAPQPGLADLGDLVEATRRAGVTVTLHGAVPAVDGPVGLAAYRIVQEALANAARHAPGAPVRVAVTDDGDTVAVRVENDAPAAAPDPAPGDGHGLAGMHERATLLGGTFEAGPTVFGGFAVTATLPTVTVTVAEGRPA